MLNILNSYASLKCYFSDLFYFLKIVCLCMSVGTHVGQKRVSDHLGPGVIGGYEPPHMGSGK